MEMDLEMDLEEDASEGVEFSDHVPLVNLWITNLFVINMEMKRNFQ